MVTCGHTYVTESQVQTVQKLVRRSAVESSFYEIVSGVRRSGPNPNDCRRLPAEYMRRR